MHVVESSTVARARGLPSRRLRTCSALGKRTTYASDIDRIGRQHFGPRWGGVLARDTLPEPGHMRVYVVNTDASTGRGVHWLAAMDVQGKRYFNDPLGITRQNSRAHRALPSLQKPTGRFAL